MSSWDQSAECRPCAPRSTTLGEEVSPRDYGYELLHTDRAQLESTSTFK